VRNLKYGPFFPIKIGVRATNRIANRILVKIDDRKIGQGPEAGEKQEARRFSPVFGGFPEGSGTGGGVILRPMKSLDGLELEGRVTTSFSQRYAVRYLQDAGPVRTGPEIAFHHYSRQDFFGEGPGASESDWSNFAISETSGGWKTEASVGQVQLRHGIYARHVNVGTTEAPHPPIQETFAEAAVSGGFGDSSWLTNEVGLAFDRRDDPRNPRAGSLIDTSLNINKGINSTTTDFSTLETTGTLYVPLTRTRSHVLAFRADAVRTISGDVVPFHQQPTLGGSKTLRGYVPYRFHGRDRFAASSEYRYAIWRRLDAAVFLDIGQVYSDIFKEMGSTGMNSSWGAGLRLNGPRSMKFRLYAAHSPEGTRLVLNMGPTW
jgi:outer membrane protein assembly factor BamA